MSRFGRTYPIHPLLTNRQTGPGPPHAPLFIPPLVIELGQGLPPTFHQTVIGMGGRLGRRAVIRPHISKHWTRQPPIAQQTIIGMGGRLGARGVIVNHRGIAAHNADMQGAPLNQPSPALAELDMTFSATAVGGFATNAELDITFAASAAAVIAATAELDITVAPFAAGQWAHGELDITFSATATGLAVVNGTAELDITFSDEAGVPFCVGNGGISAFGGNSTTPPVV